MNYADAGYIYAIKNRENGNAYIGSTTNYKSRWHTHRSTLRRGVHHSFILQKAWNKYGESAFDFQLLLVCPIDQRLEYETKLMSLESYNVLRTPKECGVRGGWKHSDEFKAKISAVHKGKKLSQEHKANIAAAATGRVYDDEFRAKARKRQLGVTPSESTRRLISEANKGRIVSSETCAKLSESTKNSKRTSGLRMDAIERVKKAMDLVSSGVSAHTAMKAFGLSSATYYKYAVKAKD